MSFACQVNVQLLMVEGKKSTYKIIGINCHANPVTRHNIYQSFKGQVGVAFGTFLEEIFACFRVDFFKPFLCYRNEGTDTNSERYSVSLNAVR